MIGHFGFEVDLDEGSVRKDAVLGQNSVSTGATFKIHVGGIGLEEVAWERDIEFSGFPPGCLYCEPSATDEIKLVPTASTRYPR